MVNREDEPADEFSTDGDSEESDSYRSIFADLLDRVEGEHGISESSLNPFREGESQASPRSENDEDPLERVRNLIPEGLAPPPIESGRRNERGRKGSGRPAYFGIAIVLAIAILIPGVAAFTVGQVDDTFFAPPPADYVNSDDTMYLEANDASYLNRIFQETTHEVAYCGLITHEEQPRLKVWMANTVDASPTEVAFLTENCPEEMREVLIHTHPNGVLELSEQDKRTLYENPARFMCVQGGQIKTEPGAKVNELACYRQPESTSGSSDLSRIPLRIADGT